MSRVSSFFLCLAALLASVAAVRGEDAKTPRTDLYGDPLPPGVVARLGTIRLRHPGAQVTFSTDGKHLISYSGADGRVWDVATGKLVRRRRLAWKLHEQEQFQRIFLSPNGATVAAWDWKTVALFETATGKKRSQFPVAPEGNDPLLTFSEDGKLLAVQRREQGQLVQELWDVMVGKKRQTLATPTLYNLSEVAFAPDGKRLAGIVEEKIHLWDTTTGKEISKSGASPLARCTAFSPDGKTLAVGTRTPGEVWLLDAATLKEKTKLKGPTDGRIGPIDRLAFSPDGRGLAGTSRSFWHLIHIWSLDGLTEPRPLRGRFDSWFAFAPDSKMLAGYDAGGSETGFWEVASGRQLHLKPGHTGSVGIMAASADGQTIVSGGNGRVLWLWDAATGKPLHELQSEDDYYWPQTCLFAPDGKHVYAGTASGTLRMWDVATGKERRRFKINGVGSGVILFHAVGVSADGKRLTALASEDQQDDSTRLLVWDLGTGKQHMQRTYTGRDHSVSMPWTQLTHVALAPDGDGVTVWREDRAGIAETATGGLLVTLPRGENESLRFSPNGRLIATPVCQGNQPRGGVKCLSLIEAASGEEAVRLETGEFTHAAFTPDSRAVVVVDHKSLRVWGTDTGERLYQRTWPEDVSNICSLVVLPGGRAATGMNEGDILVWDLAVSTWPVRKSGRDLSRKELDALWSDLASDARKASHAIPTLAAAPAQVVPLLRDRLQPVAMDGKRIDKLLADLDSEDFSSRQTATHELSGLCDRIEPLLRRTLQGPPSLEVRRRLQAILAQPRRPSAERLRTMRAIAVLERIGTPEARRILEKLSGGAAARETQEAKAALQRLNRR